MCVCVFITSRLNVNPNQILWKTNTLQTSAGSWTLQQLMTDRQNPIIPRVGGWVGSWPILACSPFPQPMSFCPPPLPPPTLPRLGPRTRSAACSIFRLRVNRRSATADRPTDVDITSYSCLLLGFPLLVSRCWPWMSLDMTNTLIHTCHFTPTHPGLASSSPGSSSALQRWRRGEKMKEGQKEKKIQREGRKSVGAVERRGGRRWEYVCGCFILLRGCGWRLVGGGMGPGWFSSLMSSIWLTQTQEVTRAACLVNTVPYLCDTPESRGQTQYFYYLISPPSAGHWVSPPLCISMSTSWYFWSSGASLILWLKPVQFWGWKQSHLNTFFSDSSLCFIFSFLGLLMETCVDAALSQSCRQLPILNLQ